MLLITKSQTNVISKAGLRWVWFILTFRSDSETKSISTTTVLY